MKIKTIAAAFVAGMCVMACSEKNELPPTETVEGTWSNFDASDYGVWNYVNLETGEVESHPVPGVWEYTSGNQVTVDEEEVTIDWHIAIHRYEIRTNNGAVVTTDYTNMDDLVTLPTDGYVQDEEIDSSDDYALTVDMSGMMTSDGVGYAQSAIINRELCAWVTVTATGTMPPYEYTPTQKVMVLRCQDGTCIKLQFTHAGNTGTGTSGYLSFNYEFVTE